MSGALLNAPVLWLALVLPLLLRARGGGRGLGLFALAVAWMGGASLLTLSLFFGCCSRYQFEFVPELALLAALGILALESLPRSPARTLARWGWLPALALSCAFPVLYGIDRCVTDHAQTGYRRLEQGDLAGAGRDFEAARALSPSSPAARLGAGQTLLVEGRLPGARAAFEGLIREEPDNAMAHFLLGRALSEEGRIPEAIAEYATASGLEPRNETIRVALEAARAGRP
jgi:tetratricopeptide (TPR) repeat protein